MSEALPVPLTPSERVALERIKAGEEVTAETAAKVLARGWARRSRGTLIITDAGRAALLDDLSARFASRSARTRRPK